MEGIEVAEQEEVKETGKKRIFVAGATGKTGRRIVDKLLSKGFGVRAGVIDLEKAKTSLPTDSNVQIVRIFRMGLVWRGLYLISLYSNQ